MNNFLGNNIQQTVLFVLFAINVLLCISEERDIYLVLLEGEPAAFRQANSAFDKHEKQHLFDREACDAHAKRLVDSHNEFLQSTLDEGSYNKLYSFKHIVDGFAVHTTHSQVKRLKGSPRVKIVEKDRGAKLMTSHSPEFLGLPLVWTDEKGNDGFENAGEGIVIGFVDSGINPLHPSFSYDPSKLTLVSNGSRFSGACEGGPLFPETSCNGKVVSARFFAAGAQAAAVLNSSVDILSPFDSEGHGSHVASTAAGNFGVPVVVDGFFFGRANGMAPRARIAVYKAVYPTVGTLTDVLAAIDQAVLDGVDILTLSVGPDAPPEDTLTFLSAFDIFLLSARKAGVFVVQAAGNLGPGPYSVVSYSPWAFGVAACNTDRTYPGTLTLGNGQNIGGVGLSGTVIFTIYHSKNPREVQSNNIFKPGPSFGNGLIQYRLVLARDAIRVNRTFPKTPDYIDECQSSEALDPTLVHQSVVICTFSTGFYNGTSNLTAIIDTAKMLGFAGFVLVANPDYGDFIAEPIPFSDPGILIPRASDAKIISEYYEQQTQRDKNGVVIRFSGRAAIGEGRTASYTERAPVVSRFSSRGPDYIDQKRNPTDVLKPDILAPGHQIWAAWSPMSVQNPILSGYSFALISGTSMATPHIAGIAAIIKQKNPYWSPSMIASAMSTTARKHDNRGDPIMAEGFAAHTLYPAAPFGFGAGLVDPVRALDPGLVFSADYEDYLNFLCSLPNTDPEKIRSATGGTCAAAFSNPLDLNQPSVTVTALSGMRMTQRVVKNVARIRETYLCAVFPPNGVTVKVDPSWFTLAPGESQILEIRFLVDRALDDFSFGEIVLTGSLNHIVRMPLSVFPISA
ncbi:Subtilisin-like protease SBT2.4 [Striga hermonthica]|uniref:Subtilisin-like protease SBT2.4 n=1 Tax=Striga hermonthica TaxID=68872 RepID=A0A9N7MXH1_STRHE|nr:Subtilisin-like protease SBT2.4 [Striga hermonthica]